MATRSARPQARVHRSPAAHGPLGQAGSAFYERGGQHILHQGALARSGDAGHDREPGQGDRDVDIAEISQRGPAYREEAIGRRPPGRGLDTCPPAEVAPAGRVGRSTGRPASLRRSPGRPRCRRRVQGRRLGRRPRLRPDRARRRRQARPALGTRAGAAARLPDAGRPLARRGHAACLPAGSATPAPAAPAAPHRGTGVGDGRSRET